MAAMQTYDVLYIGNYTKDTIISPAGVKYVDGGGMNYAAHAANRLGVRAAVVTRLAREDEHVVRKFQEAGIDTFPFYSPSSTLMRLEYPTTDPDIRTLSVAGTAESISAEHVTGLSTRAAVIGSSLRGEVGLDVIKALKENGVRVAADMQGYVRVLRGASLVYEPWPEMAETVAHLDFLKSDMVEAEFLTGKTDRYEAAKFYAGLGAREIVLTHKDGLLIYADGKFYEYGFFPRQLTGRSGRGDTCVGSYVAMRLSKEPREAGMWAAATTSLKMEALGPFNGTPADVEDLIRRCYTNGNGNHPAA